MMEVLLRKDVERLGRMGDVVKVTDGYARNFLLPKRIAVPVTSDNLRQLDKVKQARAQREVEEMERVTRQAEMLEGFLCFLAARATEQGHLFGSVGAAQVAEQLAASGFEGIRPTNVNLERPIDSVGDYEVELMLHPKVRTHILVRVAREEEEED